MESQFGFHWRKYSVSSGVTISSESNEKTQLCLANLTALFLVGPKPENDPRCKETFLKLLAMVSVSSSEPLSKTTISSNSRTDSSLFLQR